MATRGRSKKKSPPPLSPPPPLTVVAASAVPQEQDAAAATVAATATTTTTTTTTTRKMMRLRKEIEALDQEMEVAQHGRVHVGKLNSSNGNNNNNNQVASGSGGDGTGNSATGGHFRRVLPRNQSKARTQKRKLLESQDAQKASVYEQQEEEQDYDETNNKKRLRGPMAAAENAVIQGSLIFGARSTTTTTSQQAVQASILENGDDDGGGKMDSHGSSCTRTIRNGARATIHSPDQLGDDDDALDELEEEYEPGAIEDMMEDEAEDDDMEDDEDDQEYDAEAGGETTATTQHGVGAAAAVAAAVNKRPKRKYKKKMYQLKNFRSHRMAQRHGEAIGAFVQGRPKVAIAKLKELAHDAPLAPQVYSSLGMVYEDMLRTYQKEWEQERSNLRPLGINHDDQVVAGGSASKKPPPLLLERHEEETAAAAHHTVQKTSTSIDQRFTEQLDLAKKAYGSFHIAAVLCRQDYTIWVRAADMAMEIAAIHERTAQLPGASEQAQDWHCEEKVRWLMEAKNDYQTADKLKPPGIEVPAKLASVMIDLGHLSDALTLLTDLKNRHSTTESARRGKPSEFESSYKAWLLYSDLMLRIGFECIEWSRGSEGNSNYSFRRWLRKWADSFDWEERRTQALVKALEAAAGTKSCRALLEWMEQRALISLAGNEEKDVSMDACASNDSGAKDLAGHAASTVRRKPKDYSRQPIGAPFSTNGGDVEDTRKDTPLGADDQAEDGKQDETFLFKRNQKELEDFDKTTMDLGIAADSIVAKERDKERLELVARQSQIAILEMRTNSSKSKDEANGGGPKFTSACSNAPRIELPLDASVPVEEVCNIASELMRHVLDSGLYEEGRLVSEAVASYMKSRAAVHDEHMRQRETRKAAQRSNRAPDAPLAFAAEYDDVNNNDSSDESSVDLFEEAGYGEETYNLMRRGVLPHDLQVMYALSLAALGGKNFAASKCLEAIRGMEQENVDWLSEEDTVEKDSVSHSWLLFRQSRTGRLGRIDAFVMVANVMKAAGKEKDFVALLTQLFGDEQERLETGGLFDACHSWSDNKKDKIVTLITALARYKIYEATTHAGETLLEDTRLKLLDSIDLINELAPFLFTVNDDGSLSLALIDMLRAVAEVHMLLAKSFDQSDLYASSLNRASQSLSRWMRILSRCPDPDVFNLLSSSGKSRSPDLEECPYASNWQSPAQLRLSERCFNLLVAMNISSYCGWGSIDSPYLLRRQRDSPEYFGLILTDMVAGHLPASCEEEMVRQWDLVSQCRPEAAASLNLSSHLATLHGSIWYKENTDSFHHEMKARPIARFGEDAAMNLSFSFSKVCLLLAAQDEADDKRTRDVMLSNALSILLPVLQFGLHRTIWKCEIGGEAATRSVNTWRVIALRNKSDLVRTRKRVPSVTIREKEKNAAEGWFKGESFMFPLSNLIAIPMAELRCLWRNKAEATAVCHGNRSADELMHNVHVSMKQLRRCFTEHATERQSHKVAVSLFELSEHHFCENPFFCLQQAAQFATQSPKRGNNDEPFKAPLPKPEACTPREALIILGRADCLQSLHFCDEAAFLCNYVASLCSRHRVSSASDFEWSKEWNVLSILTYNLSVMIRSTAKIVLKDEKAFGRFEWSPSTLEELQRGRLDGVALTKHLPTAMAGRYVADPPECATINDNTTIHFAQAKEVGVSVDGTREHDTACMEGFSQPLEQTFDLAPDPDPSHVAAVSDGTNATGMLPQDELFEHQREGQSQFPSEVIAV